MKFSNEIKDYKQNFKKDRKSKMILLGGLFSFLGVILIKTIIRPQHFHLSTLGTFLQGTLPNFFAATGFCAIVFIYYNLFFKNDQDASLSKRITFASLFAFIGLTSWEIIQYFMGYPIDYDDILMTALGSLTMSFVILTIYKFVTDVKSKQLVIRRKTARNIGLAKVGRTVLNSTFVILSGICANVGLTFFKPTFLMMFFTQNLLLNTDLAISKIAVLVGVSKEFVEEIKAKLGIK